MYQRQITKPVPESVKLYLNDVELLPDDANHAFYVNYQTGIIHFSQALPENTIIYADFDFDVPVRFNSDYFIITETC